MYKSVSITSFFALSLFSLGACGHGANDDGNISDSLMQQMSQITETTAIAGSSINAEGDVARAEGNLTADQSLTVSGLDVAIIDAEISDDGSIYIGGNQSFEIIDGLDAVQRFAIAGNLTDGTNNQIAVIGVPTNMETINSTETITFSGQSNYSLRDNTEGTMRGQSDFGASVDLESGIVNMDFDNFQDDEGVVKGVELNSLSVKNAVLEGSHISGGNLIFETSAENKDYSSSATLSADLFGNKLHNSETLVPAEVGGVLSAKGEDGSLGLIFIGH